MDQMMLLVGELLGLVIDIDEPEGSAQCSVDLLLAAFAGKHGRETAENVLRVAQQAGFAVYAMGVVALTPNGRAFATERARKLLALASLN